MRFLLGLILVVVLLGVGASYLGLIDVSQTRDGKLPEIKAEAGQLPKFDVNTADVAIGTKNTSVEVPTIKTERETVEIPTVDVKKAK